MVKIAAECCRADRNSRYQPFVAEAPLEKSAYDLVDGLRAALENTRPQSRNPVNDPEVNPNALSSEDSAGNATNAATRVVARGPQAAQVVEQHRDMIDEILMPKSGQGS